MHKPWRCNRSGTGVDRHELPLVQQEHGLLDGNLFHFAVPVLFGAQPAQAHVEFVVVGAALGIRLLAQGVDVPRHVSFFKGGKTRVAFNCSRLSVSVLLA